MGKKRTSYKISFDRPEDEINEKITDYLNNNNFVYTGYRRISVYR